MTYFFPYRHRSTEIKKPLVKEMLIPLYASPAIGPGHHSFFLRQSGTVFCKYIVIYILSATWSMVYRQTAWASPGGLLDMQMLWPPPQTAWIKTCLTSVPVTVLHAKTGEALAWVIQSTRSEAEVYQAPSKHQACNQSFLMCYPHATVNTDMAPPFGR